jgi:hypothetical protein
MGWSDTGFFASSIPIPTFPNYSLRVAVDSHPLPGAYHCSHQAACPHRQENSNWVRNLRTAGQSSKNGHLHITPENCAAADQSQHTAGIKGCTLLHSALRRNAEFRACGQSFQAVLKWGMDSALVRALPTICASPDTGSLRQRLALRDCAYLCDLWRT